VAAALERADIGGFFSPTLSIFSSDVRLTKDKPEIFTLAVDRAGRADRPSVCVFVGEDARERGNAEAAGLLTAISPQEISDILIHRGGQDGD